MQGCDVCSVHESERKLVQLRVRSGGPDTAEEDVGRRELRTRCGIVDWRLVGVALVYL